MLVPIPTAPIFSMLVSMIGSVWCTGMSLPRCAAAIILPARCAIGAGEDCCSWVPVGAMVGAVLWQPILPVKRLTCVLQNRSGRSFDRTMWTYFTWLWVPLTHRRCVHCWLKGACHYLRDWPRPMRWPQSAWPGCRSAQFTIGGRRTMMSGMRPVQQVLVALVFWRSINRPAASLVKLEGSLRTTQ